MCVQTKNIIKSKVVVFMEDSTSVGNDFKIHLSRRNKTPTMNSVNKYLPLIDQGEDFEDHEEQTKASGITN